MAAGPAAVPIAIIGEKHSILHWCRRVENARQEIIIIGCLRVKRTVCFAYAATWLCNEIPNIPEDNLIEKGIAAVVGVNGGYINRIAAESALEVAGDTVIQWFRHKCTEP
jgi:hypothetical protein